MASPTLVPSGAVYYGYTGPDAESPTERANRERYWRSLGKKIRKNARI
ncbi:hypothetical protein Drose_04550 [Dactylosporangium roseum]|uniref:Uncharacterized protein n=1 Tax=Dactylosporangium roseum TaxID=47989 RepID=A0ABY5Z972_9ACTN|nr:hypothetical protein [Dactylosporangium roseum]UWZ37560.1 hypothetical protein Drose_04550 [Dactylosporangium roseum]